MQTRTYLTLPLEMRQPTALKRLVVIKNTFVLKNQKILTNIALFKKLHYLLDNQARDFDNGISGLSSQVKGRRRGGVCVL